MKYVLATIIVAIMACQEQSESYTPTLDEIAEAYCDVIEHCDTYFYTEWEEWSSCEDGIIANMMCDIRPADMSTAAECMALIETDSCEEAWPFYPGYIHDTMGPCWVICDGEQN